MLDTPIRFKLKFKILFKMYTCFCSDVVVQILDARNPLLFRCLDLEAYVKEVDERKTNVLLLNKADFLTEFQR